MTKTRIALIASAALAGTGLMFLGTGCPDRPLAAPIPFVVGQGGTVITASIQKNVDVLFMIDNSPSMSPKQQALASQFQNFLTPLVNAGANFHVGLVTSDCGALPTSGSLSGPLGGKCDSVTGDNGMLQATPCSARASTDFSSGSVQGICSSVCPTAVSPAAMTLGDGQMVSANFIADTGGMTAPITNVAGDDIAHAFACLAFVGDTGCGIEMQLESMKRALDGTAGAQNAGFLRKDALLALVMFTDEDDCSVQNRMSNDPMTMDCGAGGKDPDTWSCYNPDYRCFAEGTKCSQALDNAGPKTGCVTRPMNNPADPNLYLFDLSNYTKFFDTLKPAGSMLVYGVVSPAAQTGGKVVIDANLDGPGTPGLNRADTSDPGNADCNSGVTDPVTGLPIIGKPQTRLHDFITHFNGIEYSVCSISNYATVLSDIGNHIKNALGSACLPPLPTPSTSTVMPDNQCTVEQVGGSSNMKINQCNGACCTALYNDPGGKMTDPSVMSACSGNMGPCWCAVGTPSMPPAACPTKADPTLIGVYWGSAVPAPGSQTTFSCETPL